jgi:hypothetical protein
MTRAKWTGVVAQVMEHLLCKCETLISNPSSTRGKKKKKQTSISLSLRNCNQNPDDYNKT